jgi:hypothetical protein
LDARDVPASRGGPAEGAEVAAAEAGPEDAGLAKVRARIAKMLALGLHPGTSEAEAQQSMRQAQRLLAKYSLDQAEVMAEAGGLRDEGALAGGLVKVELRGVGTHRPAQIDRVASGLA